MGQALSSETHSISGGDGYKYWVGLQMKVLYRGCKKTVYKGILLGSGPRWGERVVVKAFTNVDGTKDNWRHEIVKADATKQMASMFKQKCHGSPSIRVIIPGLVQMDKVSKVNRWWEDRQGNRSLSRDDWVSVEEYLPGEVKRFCPWNTVHDPKEVSSSGCLEAFSHFTFYQSQGMLLACDFQGTAKDEGTPSASYIITDTIIHSVQKNYGPFDQGDEGINEFFKLHKCSSMCRGWPVPTPLTPPPSFSNLDLTPPPAFEDIVFPFPRNPEVGENCQRRRATSVRVNRRRHATGDDSEQSRSNSVNHNLLRPNYNSFDSIPVLQQVRTRSHSSSTLSRSHHQTEFPSHSNSQQDAPIVPSAPPMYEDCVKGDAT